MSILFSFFFAFLGWLLFAVFHFARTENKEKDNFDFARYRRERRGEWIGSFVLACLLITVGHAGLGLDFVTIVNSSGNLSLQWSDLWYAGSGPLFEILLAIYEKYDKLKS